MNAGKAISYLALAIAGLMVGTGSPGFAQQAGAVCAPEIAQAHAHIWRVQAALDITREEGSGASRALAQALPQGEASGAGRSTMPPQGEVSGAGRSTMPPQGEVSGAGRALAGAPGFTPFSGVGRVSGTANAQFRVLASNQDRKAFLETLNEQERKVLYQSLSAQDRKRIASALPQQDVKTISAERVSDQAAKAWAENIAADRAALGKKVQQARAMVRAAHSLCTKGDSAGAAAKAKEAMALLQ